jgi:ankyrin repeat protein
MIIVVCVMMHQHIAALKGHEECVSVLLKHGCNVHLRGNTHVYPSIYYINFSAL